MGTPASSYGAGYGGAKGYWDAQGKWVEGDRAGAATRRGAAGSTADEAYGGVTGFQPTATQGYEPN